jgi:hypothetical protein
VICRLEDADYEGHTLAMIRKGSLVETMTVARWRLLLVWGAQKTAMDRDMALQDSVGPAPVRVLAALRGTPETLCPQSCCAMKSPSTVNSPEPYHPQFPAGHTWKQENTPPAERTPEALENTQAEKIDSAPCEF